ERLELDRADLRVHGVEVDVRRRVAPARGDRRREDAVVRLHEGRVAVAREPVELRTRRLEHDEVGEARDDEDLVAVALDDRRAGLLVVPDERVVVLALRGLDAVPGVLLDLPAAALDPREVLDEVLAEADREVLDRADAVTGERVDRVL